MSLSLAQKNRLAHITNLIEKYYGKDGGAMQYTLETTSGDAVLLCASNTTDLRWFETHYLCYYIITKGGGIARYAGNMLPTLVCPATPRLCDYTSPFKKSKKDVA